MEQKDLLGVSVPNAVIESADIPSIHLYMDQITTFIDEKLAPLKRYPEDKILTKTMINNYAKAKLFPPPVKKQYTKNHLMLLILIYHLKAVLTLGDIEKLLAPVNQVLLQDPDSNVVEQLYSRFVAMQKGAAPDSEEPILLVLNLVLRANGQKRLAERLIDTRFC